MALVIYAYKFKNAKYIHLAAELTAMSPDDKDKYNNYISYVSYNESEIAADESKRFRSRHLTAKDGCGPVSGFNAASFYEYIDFVHRHIGYGYNSKKYDKNKLIYLGRVIISTYEDGNTDSEYKETVIYSNWQKFRPKDNEEAAEGKLKSKFEFNLTQRHCGTIVHNILENKDLARAINELEKKSSTLSEAEPEPEDETKVTREDITKSLVGTIIKAQKAESNTDVLKEYYLIDDLLDFYKNYRLWKSFWQRDDKAYGDLLALCTQKGQTRESESTTPIGFVRKDMIPRDLRSALDSHLAKLEVKTGNKSDDLLTQKAIQALNSYLDERKAIDSEYTGFLSGFSGYTRTDKLEAVKKVLTAFKNRKEPPAVLSDNEYAALFEGKLYKFYVSKFEEIIKMQVTKKIPLNHYSNNVKMFHK